MKSGYWNIGNWRNIPFSLHWSILLWLLIYWSSYHDLAWAAISLVAFTALLVAHEVGHAVAAMSRSLRVHAIELHMLRGLCIHEAAYYERDAVLIAWGGVLGQLCVLVLAIAAQYALTLSAPDLAFALAPLFYVFIKANIVLAVINLIPVAPLDGHTAWRVIPLLRRKYAARRKTTYGSGGNVIQFRRRGKLLKESQRMASDLMERLKKK